MPWFRLGVAHRMRHESAGRRPGDFQAAIDAWGRALELDPNQYIWRRRIEQYGPRLTKPYAFYDWVVPAKAEISRRGETPVPLAVEPYGSELAGPVRDVVAEASVPLEPDPKGQIHRDVAAAHRGRGGRRAGAGPPRPGRSSPRHVPPRRGPQRALEQRIDPAAGLGRRGRGMDDRLSAARRRRRATSPSRLRSAASTSR